MFDLSGVYVTATFSSHHACILTHFGLPQQPFPKVTIKISLVLPSVDTFPVQMPHKTISWLIKQTMDIPTSSTKSLSSVGVKPQSV